MTFKYSNSLNEQARKLNSKKAYRISFDWELIYSAICHAKENTESVHVLSSHEKFVDPFV